MRRAVSADAGRTSCSPPRRDGDRAALARLLSLIERGGDEAARDRPARLSARRAAAYTVGLTGAPGAGKSTLTSALIGHLRAQDVEVAVLAIDPSSPFTGGAILGDRVRMQDHATDPGVFIRSMATRGHLGGSVAGDARGGRGCSTRSARPWMLVETVGVGQVEVEIAGKADTTVVVVNPGWGDAVQANKAGLMEIADVFVINKADRKGVDETRRDLEQMLELSDLGARGLASADPPRRRHHRRGRRRAVGRRRCTPGRDRSVGRARPPARSSASREELREIVARRLEQRARELATGERWDELQLECSSTASTRGPPPTRCSRPSTPDPVPHVALDVSDNCSGPKTSSAASHPTSRCESDVTPTATPDSQRTRAQIRCESDVTRTATFGSRRLGAAFGDDDTQSGDDVVHPARGRSTRGRGSPSRVVEGMRLRAASRRCAAGVECHVQLWHSRPILSSGIARSSSASNRRPS